MENKKTEELKGYPSHFVPSSTKKQKEFGLQYVKAMWAEYLNGNLINSAESRQQRYINLRKYANGLQSIDKYKDQISANGDNSYMNLDWQSISVIPKFRDVVVNSMLNQSYKIQCNAIDAIAKSEKDKKRNELLGNMFMASKIQELPEQVREKLLPKNAEVPADRDELELYMNLNYKQAVEIAMEEGIEYVMYNNDWDAIKMQLFKDLFDLNIAGVRNYFDENDDIRVRCADPVNLVTTYSESPYFNKSLRHAGEIIQMTIGELRQAAQNNFTEEQYWKLAKNFAGKNGNRKWTYGDTYYSHNFQETGFDDFLIDILDFEFLSSDTFVFEKKSNGYGGYYFQHRDEEYELPKKSKRKRELVTKKIQTVYSGKWIIGSDYMFDYDLKENMTREKINGSYSTETQLSFIIISPDIRDMENKSYVEKIMPFADQMQLIYYKIQQHVAKSRPKGVAMDITALTGVMKGMGFDGFQPIEIQKMYDQLGSFFYSSVRDDGTPIQNTRPIEELQNGIGNDIQPLILLYNQNLQQIRDVTGINEARDGASADKDSLVGLEKLRLMASNNATRGLNYAYINIYERTAKQVALMIQDKVESGQTIEGYYNALGEQNIKTIKLTGDDMELREIGIKIEALPDEEERQLVESNIQQSLANDTLRLEDSIAVRQVLKQSVKLANQLLVQRRKKYQQEKMQEQQMASQQNAMVQQQAAEAKAQADAQAAQMKAMAEQQKLQAEFDLKSKLSAQEHEQKMKEIALANQYKAEQIKLASEENFKNTALSKEMPQPRVMPGTRTS